MSNNPNIPLKLKKQFERWYKLKDHPVQLELVKAIPNGVRFPLVPAGRRSGKTERFKRFLSKLAMATPNEKYFAAAPTYAQAKKIFWNDLKDLTLSYTHLKRPSETELQIYLPNNTEIHILGMDKPERIEGVNWTGGGIDEIANIKSKAVNENIMPALDTENPTKPGYHAWCWFLGVPDGLNHYYTMCQNAETGKTPDAKVFHWKSAEILSPEVIAAAKRRMSKRQYKQEYEASFETASGRIYEDYSSANYTKRTIQPHEQILWMHDQNFTPLSSAIGVREEEKLFLLDEIVLTSAKSEQSAIEFVEKYKNHQNKHLLLYGDPSGKNGEKHGHESDYIVIEKILTKNGWKVERRIRPGHPPIKDRQNAVRAKIRTADDHITLFVNPETAPWCHNGLATVQVKEGSTFQEDQTNEYQHITTAIGYCIEFEWSLDEAIIFTGIGSVH
jgi:hypothetical protein